MNAKSLPDTEVVFCLWCRLTGTDAADFTAEEKRAFLARPQVPALAGLPFEALLDAGITAASHASLPLERWLDAAHATPSTRR